MSAGKGKTSMGLEPNLAGLLCYVLGWVTGLIFYIQEKENEFVRFHAVQSMVTFGALTAASVILSFIGVGGALASLLSILGLVLGIVLMMKAYQGQRYKLPWVGEFAEKQIRTRPSTRPSKEGMTAYCPRCGNQLSPDERFCGNCGSPR